MAEISLNDEKSINVNLSQESTLNTQVQDINYIPSYIEAEKERRKNEIERINNELSRISNEEERERYITGLKRRVLNGEFNGKDGKDGVDGKDGEKGDKGDPGEKGDQGEQGEKGEPGAGIIPGGKTGQYLRKSSDEDYATEWANVESGGGGYIDLDSNSRTKPLILENLNLGVYAIKGKSSKINLYVKATSDSDVYMIPLDNADGSNSIFNYFFPILEADDSQKVAMITPSTKNPDKRILINRRTTNSYGLSSSKSTNGLIPSSAIGSTIPSLETDKTNTYESTNVYNVLPTSSVVPTEDEQFINKKYADTLANIPNNAVMIDGTSTGKYNLSSVWATLYVKGRNTSLSYNAGTLLNRVVCDCIKSKSFPLIITGKNSTGALNYPILRLNVESIEKLVETKPSSIAFTGFAYQFASSNNNYVAGYGYVTILYYVTWGDDGLPVAMTTGTYPQVMKMATPVLNTNNTESFTPSSDYNPVHKKYVDDSLKEILNSVYPIGRGFIDFTDTDYSNYLGFTWERELVGMTPIGLDTSDTDFDTIGKTGGEKKHQLSYSELPAEMFGGESSNKSWSAGHWGDYSSFAYTYTNLGDKNNVLTGGTTSQAHNNLQPYKVVAFWKRVS